MGFERDGAVRAFCDAITNANKPTIDPFMVHDSGECEGVGVFDGANIAIADGVCGQGLDDSDKVRVDGDVIVGCSRGVAADNEWFE